MVQPADGAEAVEIARRHRPALSFLDLIMPGVDGWEVMALLQLDRRSERIPVVAITSSEPPPEKLQQAGFCALLAKPFLPADLVSAMQICLDGRSRGEFWIPDLARQITAG